MGSSLIITVRYASSTSLIHPYVGLAIEDSEGRRVYSINTKMAAAPIPEKACAGEFTCELTALPLNHGIYFITLQLNEGSRSVDRVEKACQFEILPKDVYGSGQVSSPEQGCLYWPSTWKYQVHD
jgi:lipopolysaccharide transport system ATP-binding protein